MTITPDGKKHVFHIASATSIYIVGSISRNLVSGFIGTVLGIISMDFLEPGDSRTAARGTRVPRLHVDHGLAPEPHAFLGFGSQELHEPGCLIDIRRCPALSFAMHVVAGLHGTQGEVDKQTIAWRHKIKVSGIARRNDRFTEIHGFGEPQAKAL